MKRNKHYMWQSVKGTTRIDIDETHTDKKPIKELLDTKQRNRTLDMWVAILGYIIGGMLGMWILIEIVQRGISK